MGVSVEYLKKITFTELSLHEKLEIKDKGRSTPNIIITQTGTSNNKKYIRSFNSDWYEKVKWLCGCDVTNRLFCFPCLLFGCETVWTKNGFSNINRIKEKCEKHENSRKHMENVVSLLFLQKLNIVEQLSEAYETATIKHNDQVRKNREILSQLIDCIKFCGQFELPLRGHDERSSSENPGVFRGLINFVATFDSILQRHLDNSTVFRDTSTIIQNELLQNILEVCREQIILEIGETSFVAVMSDDTTDVSETPQIVIVFRYELDGIIYERFWGVFNPENVNAEGISSCILKEIDIVLKNNPSKLIAQTYDGANVMEEEQGVQHKIQQLYPNAYYIHCYAHQLNLVIKHVSASFKSARLFFANLSGIAAFFSKSPQRLATLEKFVNERIPSTRWNFNIRCVNTVFENKENLIKCFEELQSLNTTDQTIQASTSLLSLMKNDTFLFWLKLFHIIMPHVEILYSQFQGRNIDFHKIQEILSDFYSAISAIRNSPLCESTSSSRSMESKEVCDHICEEAKQRFAFTDHVIAAKLFYKENLNTYQKGIPVFEIKEICEKYPSIIREKLNTELQVFYSTSEFHNFNGLMSLLNMLRDDNLSGIFSETIKLLQILITVPMTTAEPERCFSTLKRIKSLLRNNMGQDQLTALSMISIEKNFISQIKDFNEKVIEKFCGAKHRRMDFIYK